MRYYTKPMSSLSDKRIMEISDLYSNNYGYYSKESKIKPGERIRYSVDMYKRNYIKDNFYISYAEDEEETLTGFAIYIRKKYSNDHSITWVVQLVVDSDHRGNGIASRLLQSIWGFSNDFAWGLATTNPSTIKALENATFRKVSAKEIKDHLSELEQVFNDVPLRLYRSGLLRIKSHLINKV